MSSGLHSISSELDNIDASVTESFNYCSDTVESVRKYDNDKVATLKNIESSLEKFADLQKEVSILKKTTEEMQKKLEAQEFEECTENQINSTFEKVYRYNKKNACYEEAQMDQISSLKDLISNLENSEETDDLLITENTDHYKDPITKKRIVNPLKNKMCGHYYEKNSILFYIESKERRCPYSGCPKIVSRENLCEDLELKNQLANTR